MQNEITETKFLNKVRQFGLNISISVFLATLFFAIYNYITGIYFLSIFLFIIVILSGILFYVFTKMEIYSIINLLSVFYTFLVYINILFLYEIYPSSYIYLIPLIFVFKVNYSKRLFYYYLLFLLLLIISVPFISNVIKAITNYDWYFLPSKDDLILNAVIDFVESFSILYILFLFLRELKKEKMDQKYLLLIVNKSEREDKFKKINFIYNLIENPEFENELERLFFAIKNTIEKELVFQDYKYDIAMLSKRLKSSKKQIIKALNYHDSDIDFDDFLNFYRYKAVKKSIDDNLHKSLNLKQLYNTAGFKYKSKFIAVFKYFEGINPKTYIDSKKATI